MNNDIIKLLNLEDDCVITSINISDNQTKVVSLAKKPSEKYCPICNYRMHSKGVRIRTVKHQMLLDGYRLELELHCRRYQCINPNCHYMESDTFNFVNKYRRVTNATDFLIIEAFRDHTLTFSAIARKFKVSPSYVHNVFKRYIHMERLPLSEILSIDEIYIKDDRNGKYALVIHDFITGEPIDLLSSRRQIVTEQYFASIDISERRNVKYLITDMYKPFINYAAKYFPNAVVAVDSFHVVHWILNEIQKYIRAITRQYLKRDQELHMQREAIAGKELIMHQSDEVYILKKYSWLVLANQSKIDYSQEMKVDSHFRYFMTIYDKEELLFNLVPELREMRDLKEIYIRFNQSYFESLSLVEAELIKIIAIYKQSRFEMFRDYATLLNENFQEIINSFVRIEMIDENGEIYEKRLSNGPIESFNRIPKDMKRNARGYLDFEHARNRILFATRKNATITSPKK
ncbi:MAG: ISL3 family transposase [Firmicutes bacterium]|nr:ISL3 family transposase [Bacillota bacterium]